MSDPSPPDPPDKNSIKITGISELSGNESKLRSDDEALLKDFNRVARKMGLHPAPMLALFKGEADYQGNPIPYDPVMSFVRDGTPVVLISEWEKQLTLQAETGEDGTPYQTSALERLVAAAAHEEGHIKHKDGPATGFKSIRQDFAADKEAARATCDPQAQKEALEIDFLAFARDEGKSLQQIYLEEASGDTPHPLPPTRYAQLDYMKAHPPRGCKASTRRMSNKLR